MFSETIPSVEEPTDVAQRALQEAPPCLVEAAASRCNEDWIRELLDILDDDV